jgi:hypothetical protein
MDCMTAQVTPNCIASSDKVMDELKRVWTQKFAAQYRSYSGSNFKKLRHTKKFSVRTADVPAKIRNKYLPITIV